MRKRTLLIALAIIGLGLIGTGLSVLYRQPEYFAVSPRSWIVSYGFPSGWQGYSIPDYPLLPIPSDRVIYTETYWFSTIRFLLDAVFWIVISTLGYLVIVISIDMLHKVRASMNLSVINI